MTVTTGKSTFWNIDADALDGSNWPFSFAFQPIVDARTRQVISYEALVRGPNGEPPGHVFSRVPRQDLLRFHHLCHARALQIAVRLGIRTQLNLNLFASATQVTRTSIRLALNEAQRFGFPVRDLVFEVSEAGRLLDYRRLSAIFDTHAEYGFRTAVDDFGTGYSGLKLLCEFQPGLIKLDRNITARIHKDNVRQAIARGLIQICNSLSIMFLAEGVETVQEYRWFLDEGVHIFQGFYFGRPAFELLPEVPLSLF